MLKWTLSWIKYPFLLHRRAIKTKNNILLLKKAGVKNITIDLDKSIQTKGQQTESQKKESKEIPRDNLSMTPSQNLDIQTQNQQTSIPALDKLDLSSVPLNEEINRANELKNKLICHLNRSMMR